MAVPGPDPRGALVSRHWGSRAASLGGFTSKAHGRVVGRRDCVLGVGSSSTRGEAGPSASLLMRGGKVPGTRKRNTERTDGKVPEGLRRPGSLRGRCQAARGPRAGQAALSPATPAPQARPRSPWLSPVSPLPCPPGPAAGPAGREAECAPAPCTHRRDGGARGYVAISRQKPFSQLKSARPARLRG